MDDPELLPAALEKEEPRSEPVSQKEELAEELELLAEVIIEANGVEDK